MYSGCIETLIQLRSEVISSTKSKWWKNNCKKFRWVSVKYQKRHYSVSCSMKFFRIYLLIISTCSTTNIVNDLFWAFRKSMMFFTNSCRCIGRFLYGMITASLVFVAHLVGFQLPPETTSLWRVFQTTSRSSTFVDTLNFMCLCFAVIMII